jgi:hypothetical protein
MRFEACRGVGVLLGAVLCCGCDDKGAGIGIGKQAVAEGAMFGLFVQDSCKGGGKIPTFCSREALTSVESVEVGDPGVARVLRASEIVEGLRVDGVPLAVLGVAGQHPDQTGNDLRRRQ